MDEWVANPQWWLSSAVAALMGAVMPFLYKHSQTGLKAIMLGAKGRIRTNYRRRKCNRLRKIKAMRFDSLLINRQVALTYALLVLFMTTGVATIAAIINLPQEIQKSFSMTFVVGVTLAAPALLFEFAWLKASSHVDDILKARKRIKRRSRALH